MNVVGYIISYQIDNALREKENAIQGTKIEAYCRQNALDLLEIYVEPEESRPDYHPVLIKLLNEVSKEAPRSHFEGIVVYSYEALAQEKEIRDWIISEFGKYNIRILSVAETKIEMTRLESETKSRSIKERVRDLPSLPEVVTKVTELVQNPKSSAAELSEVISHDSGLTSRVLRLVNSAYYGFPRQISSIQQAIMILGFTTIRGLVLSSSIFRIFTPKSRLVNVFDYKKFWKHSLLTAIASKKIYKELFFEDDENIFSAAILHDIGKLILDQYDHDNYAEVLAEVPVQIYFNRVLAVEQKNCEVTHPSIGQIVAEGWNLPPVLSAVIRYHHNPLAAEGFERITTSVYLGNLISQLVLDISEFRSDVFDEEVLSYIGLDEEDLVRMYNEISEEATQLEELESFFK
jgi:putative nucleotidyltransferase with HDIG domain